MTMTSIALYSNRTSQAPVVNKCVCSLNV